MKLLEESTGRKFLNIGLGNYFLNLITKAQATKAKNKLLRLHKTKGLCEANETNNKMGSQPHGMRENICKPHV
jgi:hypothetical protein